MTTKTFFRPFCTPGVTSRADLWRASRHPAPCAWRRNCPTSHLLAAAGILIHHRCPLVRIQGVFISNHYPICFMEKNFKPRNGLSDVRSQNYWIALYTQLQGIKTFVFIKCVWNIFQIIRSFFSLTEPCWFQHDGNVHRRVQETSVADLTENTEERR